MEDLIEQFIETMSEQTGVKPSKPSDIHSGMKNKLIKASNDHKGMSLYITFEIEGDKACGRWYSCKLEEGGCWHSKTNKKWSKAERDAWEVRCDEAKRKHEEEVLQRQEEVAVLAGELWRKAKSSPSHAYLKEKEILPTGSKVFDDMLLIPMKDVDGNIRHLQTILPDGTKYNSFVTEKDHKDRWLWAKGGRKQGCFGSIIKKGADLSRIALCEGFATGASISEATGLAVAVAFDAGNLEPVAISLRNKYPETEIIICADNDLWTKKKGQNFNVGLEKAKKAAEIVDAKVVWPVFADDCLDAKPTDFNDMARLEGLDRVRSIVMGKNKDKKESKKKETENVVVPIDQDDLNYAGDLPGLPFKVLGHNSNTYYYFPFSKQQIVSIAAGSHTIYNLLQLARLEQWEGLVTNLKHPSHSQIATVAADMMIAKAHEKGVFKEQDRVRGCGVWVDAGRNVAHCGSHLYVDGVKTQLKDMTGKYTYVASTAALNLKEPSLSDEEANKFIEICNEPTWENPLSGDLLAGWCVVAPISAALKDWRPHCWITGEAESGKTTIFNKIVKPALGGISINVDGQTTEAAIRNEIGYDARPIVFDEAEGKGKAKRAMEDVLQLARACSSGGSVRKYGQGAFVARSCFCFSAINPPVKDFADETRISYMSLRKNISSTAQQDYEDMLIKIEDLMDDKFYLRLFSRTYENMETLLENIQTFKTAARKVIKGARASDQIGTMLGGLYLLKSTKRVTMGEALDIIGEKDWSDHTAINQDNDPTRCLHYISTCQVRYPDGRNVTLGTLIGKALSLTDDVDNNVMSDTALQILRTYSISVSKDKMYVLIGNKDPNLERLLRETDWFYNWNKTLLNLPNTAKQSLIYFAAGNKQRGIRIPRAYFMMDEEPKEQELEF